VNAVLQYVCLCWHFLADGKWHDPISLGKPDDLFARVERLETELALLIPMTSSATPKRSTFPSAQTVSMSGVKSIKRITPPVKGHRTRILKSPTVEEGEQEQGRGDLKSF
jgi:hypothetical protein